MELNPKSAYARNGVICIKIETAKTFAALRFPTFASNRKKFEKRSIVNRAAKVAVGGINCEVLDKVTVSNKKGDPTVVKKYLRQVESF